MTSHSRTSLHRAVIVATVAAALALSACGGSTLDPAEVARANGLVNGDLGGGSGQVGTVDPATGDPVVDPATGDPVVDPATGDPVVDPGTGGSTAGPATGGGATGGGARPATGGGKAASCAGFKNTTGITDSTITIGNITDISGPVPGILTPNRDAVKAYVKYFNSTGAKICGRSLEVKSYDSQTNTSGDAVATQKACDETFASVGSMAAFDTGGLSIAKQCGIPGIHSIITNASREQDCPNCFATESGTGGGSANVIPDYFTKVNKAGTQKAAYLAVAVSASAEAMKRLAAANTKRGWKFVYTATFDIAEFNYGPYVQRLKAEGARIVYFLGSSDMAVRMLRAFKSANYKPDQFLMTATSYDKIFTEAGADVNGSIVFADFTPLEDAAKNAELRLYLQWLQQVAPGSRPTYFGEYAWSATRLFVEQAIALGGKLSRPALVASLKQVRGWTGNGLHAPHDVGLKKVSACWRFLQIQDGKWKPYGPARYMCGSRS